MKSLEEMQARYDELDRTFGSWIKVELVEYMFLGDQLEEARSRGK